MRARLDQDQRFGDVGGLPPSPIDPGFGTIAVPCAKACPELVESRRRDRLCNAATPTCSAYFDPTARRFHIFGMSQCSVAMQFAARRDGRVEKYFAAREASGRTARLFDSNRFYTNVIDAPCC
jgi:hypothetical protein